MEAIDQKIVEELQSLPEELKIRVLEFAQSLHEPEKPFDAENAKEIAGDSAKISLSEDFEEYITKGKFISTVQNLPAELQSQLLKYLEVLKAKAAKDSQEAKQKPVDKEKQPFKFKPGFGGAKGFFILKDGWDDPILEDFKDYM